MTVTELSQFEFYDEPTEPMVQKILQAIRVSDDDANFIENYASLVVELHALDVEAHSKVFIQLSLIAKDLAQREEKAISMVFVDLARIGLVPLVKKRKAQLR